MSSNSTGSAERSVKTTPLFFLNTMSLHDRELFRLQVTTTRNSTTRPPAPRTTNPPSRQYRAAPPAIKETTQRHTIDIHYAPRGSETQALTGSLIKDGTIGVYSLHAELKGAVAGPCCDLSLFRPTTSADEIFQIFGRPNEGGGGGSAIGGVFRRRSVNGSETSSFFGALWWAVGGAEHASRVESDK